MSLKWNLKRNNSHNIITRQKINLGKEAHLLMQKFNPQKEEKEKTGEIIISWKSSE